MFACVVECVSVYINKEMKSVQNNGQTQAARAHRRELLRNKI